MIVPMLTKEILFNTFNFSIKVKYYQKYIFIFSILIIPTGVFSDIATVFSRESGGGGGAPFVEMVAPNGVISKITIRSGKFIDGIQLTYQYKHRVSSRAYGGTGGTAKSFSLSKGEYITEFGGRSGKYVDSIYIKTNKGRVEKWGGKGGKRAFKFIGTKYSPIQGLWGRSGALIDAIGVIKKSKKSQGHTVQSNLKAFKPNPSRIASKNANCKKCDTITNPIYPTSHSTNDYNFWKKQNDGLYNIVQKLANSMVNSESQLSSYNNVEHDHCDGNMYCEIETRVDLINETIGAK